MQVLEDEREAEAQATKKLPEFKAGDVLELKLVGGGGAGQVGGKALQCFAAQPQQQGWTMFRGAGLLACSASYHCSLPAGWLMMPEPAPPSPRPAPHAPLRSLCRRTSGA